MYFSAEFYLALFIASSIAFAVVAVAGLAWLLLRAGARAGSSKK